MPPSNPTPPDAAPSNVTPLRRTSERVLDAALVSFASRGYEGTSLDGLAANLGVRKQTILHYFRSKEGLLDAVLARAVGDLAAEIDAALVRSGRGWHRIETVVRATFRLAAMRPELVGFVREVGRLGEPFTEHLMNAMEPLLERAASFLSAEVADGHLANHDPRHLLLQAYAAVVGAATEVEVLRSVGLEPTVRLLVRRRRELMRELEATLRPTIRPRPSAADGADSDEGAGSLAQ